MAEIQILYWRDMPAQIVAGSGRRGAKLHLGPEYEAAIDRAAMGAGAKDSDAYLAEWRRGAFYTVPGSDEEALVTEAARLRALYDKARLAALIANGGWDAPAASPDDMKAP